MEKYLTNEEMVALIKQAQAGSEDAENALMVNCTDIIIQHIRGWANGGHDLEDLLQVAYMGLLRAIRSYDVNVDTKFLSYALPCAKGEVKRFIRDNGPVKVPRTIKERAVKIKKHKLEHAPVEEIMEKLGFETELHVTDALHFIMMKSGKPLSLENAMHSSADKDDITLGDMLEGDVNGDSWLEDFISEDALLYAMRVLTDQEKKVIIHRYFDRFNQTVTGALIGVSQVHASRIERRALRKLGEAMENGVTEKKKIIVPEKPKKKQVRGDREEAIRLLKDTYISGSEISRMTGVPIGTIFNMAKKYRSKEKSDAIRYTSVEKSRGSRDAVKEELAVQ